MSDLAESAVQAALVDRLTNRDLGWHFVGPPLPLAQTWTAQYPVSRGDVDTARLNVDCRPARQFDEGGGSRGHRLSLTFRAPVSGESREDISEFPILGRDAIVRTFTDLTTPSMHDQWKRKV